jgi:hypothetical protein
MNYTLALLLALLLLAPIPLRAEEAKKDIDWEKGGGTVDAKPKRGDPAKPQSATLPRVLVIGDSISIGYTPPLQELFKGEAEVVHPPGKCMDSGHGVRSVKAWIGKGQWDVIHFNFGIWDTHYLDKKTGALIRDESKVTPDDVRIRTTPEQYRENLKKIVAALKATGARLVFATTTPVMYRKGARFEDIAKLNEIAVSVMKEEGVEVNDLYAATLPHADTWIGDDRVHMTKAGSASLADLVGARVRAAIKAGPKAKDAPPATQPQP